MNYFSSRRFWIFVIVLLLVINITALVTIWLQRHPPQRRGGPPHMNDPAEATSFFLRKELGFTSEQVDQFLRLQKEFMDENGERRRAIGNLKRDLYGSLIDASANLSENDRRITRIGREFAAIEKFTLQYFQKVKDLCTPEQRKKFDLLLGRILMRIDPIHQPPKDRSLPPHPREGGQNPPPREGRRPPPGGRPPM